MENNGRLITDSNDEEIYTKLKITLDIFLFALALWAKIGYSIFTGSSALESFLDPLKRYLYPSISSDTIHTINESLNIVTQVLSYSDATLTIVTIMDMRKKREQFTKEVKSGFRQLKSGEIKIIAFLLNLSIFTISFVVISLSPWIGLKMRNFSLDFSLASGISMFLGEMIIMVLQHGSYIFATPKRIIDFFELPRSEKKTIIKNIFCTKKGLGMTLRTLANTSVMGLRFHGIGLFSNKNLFGNNSTFGTVYSTMACISVVYRVLVTQSLNDYKSTFKQDRNSQRIDTENIQDEVIIHQNQTSTGNVLTKLLLVLLSGLVTMTFLLKTFSTPVLCTGPIDNPEENYDIPTAVLASLGLILGAFSAYQYCKFMWGLGKMASENISKSACLRSADLANGDGISISNQNLDNSTTEKLKTLSAKNLQHSV